MSTGTATGPYVSGAPGASNNQSMTGGQMNTGTATRQTATNTTGQTGYATKGMNENVDNAMTRSEEQLRVGKEAVGAGSARLDKYVTTEHVQTNVPVTKERVVIEREPVNDNNRGAAINGPEISEAHHEINLTEERAMAQKEVVPIERIRLGKQIETHDQMVGADLRKEHVDLTTTGINEKFDKVGYGRTTGTAANPTDTNETAMMGKNAPAGTAGQV